VQGINAQDITKLKAAGCTTVQSVQYVKLPFFPLPPSLFIEVRQLIARPFYLML
jgi:hypothetical protein